MDAKVTHRDESGVTIQVRVEFGPSMLESERRIQDAVNAVGSAATSEALGQFDTDGDPIEAAARAAGSRAFAATKSGSIAAIAAAKELARLRSLVDPFSATPESGYQVGGQREKPEVSSSD